jgi:hypothetical protein
MKMETTLSPLNAACGYNQEDFTAEDAEI